jgi:hypothetical protein
MRSMWSFGILLALTGCVSAGGGLLAEVKSNRDELREGSRRLAWTGRAATDRSAAAMVEAARRLPAI